MAIASLVRIFITHTEHIAPSRPAGTPWRYARRIPAAGPRAATPRCDPMAELAPSISEAAADASAAHASAAEAAATAATSAADAAERGEAEGQGEEERCGCRMEGPARC